MKDPEIPFPFLEQRKFRQRAIVKKDNDYLFICLFIYLFTSQNVNKQKTKALRFGKKLREWRHLTLRRKSYRGHYENLIGKAALSIDYLC